MIMACVNRCNCDNPVFLWRVSGCMMRGEGMLWRGRKRREILSLLVALLLGCVAGQNEAEVEASSRSPLNNVQDTVCRDGSGKTSWTTTNKAAPWQGRTGHATISFKGKMYMMGGSSASNALLNDVWMSEDGSAWAEMPGSAWGGRKRFGVADWNGKIWMVGGIMKINGQEGTSNEVWSLSSDGSKWEKVLPMSLCTAGQTVCPAAPSPTAVALNRTNGTTAPPPSGSSNPNAVVGMFAQRHSPVVVAHRSRLWVLSGVRTGVDRTAARAEDFMHDVWSSADGVSWQREVETTPWAGRRTAVGITYQTKIFMFVESSQFRFYYNVWQSTDGISWSEPKAACTISGQLVASALIIESGLAVVGAIDSLEGDDIDAAVWYSPPNSTGSDFEGVFVKSSHPVATGSRREASYVAFKGKIWQLGGYCIKCGDDLKPITFNDVQQASPSFEVVARTSDGVSSVRTPPGSRFLGRISLLLFALLPSWAYQRC